MRTLYLDCSMGASGDMLTAALLELAPDADAFLAKLNGLGIPAVTYRKEESVKCGIRGTHVAVEVNGEEEHSFFDALHEAHMHPGHDGADGGHDHAHSHDHGHAHLHSGMHEIRHIVEDLPVPARVKQDILAVYGLIAEAESSVHGVPAELIHFHEVGALDAVADVAAVCLLVAELRPERIVASPVHVGAGQVRCAHGILPVPAPATAYLLRGVPMYSGDIQGELCTPTGAALLKRFVGQFGPMPVIRAQALGYGMGTKDFAAANCVRAILGETEPEEESVTELRCNIDDMTAEEVSFAMERLFAAGAREVYTVPVGMKKSRAGLLLVVVCDNPERDDLLRVLFRYTATLGVRECKTRRFTLSRAVGEIPTPCGAVREKTASGYGVTRSKYEFEDLAHIARKNGMTLAEVRALADEAKNAR